MGAAIGWAAQVAGEAKAAEAAQAALSSPVESVDEPSVEPSEEAGNEIYAIYQQAVEAGWHEGLGEMTRQFSDALLPVLAERPGRSLAMMATHAPWWTDWLDSATSTAPYWSQDSAARREELAIPALHVSGWLDPFLQPTIDRFLAWSSRARTPELRAAQHLVIGPWAHGLSGAQWDGHVRATPEAELFAAAEVEWFQRRWLHDDLTALEASAPLRIFVMGANVWRDEWQWPLARTEWTPLYLGGAGASADGGTLSLELPTEEQPDSYDFDPADPVPAIGGAVLPGLVVPGPGQYDQRPVESRDDVLVYTAAPCTADLEVTGPVSVDVWVETSAVDTDFTAKLVDVFPDGRSVFVCQGIVRPTVGLPGSLEPKATYHLRIDLTSTSYVFKAGHAIRLEVSSSCFPQWDVNPNTGRHYATDESGETVVARQTVHHDPKHPSHVTLPVIPRDQRDS
jgi:putative CocE/NonD family hydrolase